MHKRFWGVWVENEGIIRLQVNNRQCVGVRGRQRVMTGFRELGV
jgi:hypothetical protein